MDEIVHKYKFFSAIEPPSRWTKIPVAMVGVIGSSPANKIIAEALKIAASSYKKIYTEKNNSFIKRIIRRIFKGKYIKIPDPHKSLMTSLTKAIIKNGVQPEIIMLPATYFDSIFPQLRRYDVLDEIKFRMGIHKNKNKLFKKLKPEAIGILRDFVISEGALVMEANGG